MVFFIILMRIFLIAVMFSLPSVLVGLAAFGMKGAGIGIFSTLLGLIIVGLSSERGIAGIYLVHSNIPQGLSRSLEIALQSLNVKRVPQLVIVSETLPHALVVKSLGGHGTIFLTQGLISILNEQELGAVLLLCLARLKEKSLVFQSFCSILMIWILNFAPKSWVNLIFRERSVTSVDEEFLNPISGVGFFILFPPVNILLRLSKSRFFKQNKIVCEEQYFSATRKIAQSIHIWGSRRGQTAVNFGLIDPGSGKMLFPYT